MYDYYQIYLYKNVTLYVCCIMRLTGQPEGMGMFYAAKMFYILLLLAGRKRTNTCADFTPRQYRVSAATYQHGLVPESCIHAR